MEKILKKHENKRNGFTLIELIVTMSIIGILVLLAAPRFFGQTDDAIRTKHISNARTLQEAAERYYLDYGKWPRAEIEPYSPEEIMEFSEKIFDVTGEYLELDEGDYWDIDYDALNQYASLPDPNERGHYLLRNPVGKVYVLEGLTEEGEDRVTTSGSGKTPIEDSEPVHTPEEPVMFDGIDSEGLDGNTETYHSGDLTLTWDGDLSNREIVITGRMSRDTGSMRARFYDASGNVLTTIGSSTDYTDVLDGITLTTGNVIVPSGAVRMELYSNLRLTTMFVHDIQAPEVLQRPGEPLVTSSATNRSLTLNWNTPRRVRIFRDNVLLTDDVIASYTDRPLYSDDEHTYKLLFLDEYGNGAPDYITHTAKTASDAIGFRGLTPEAFDADTETSHEGDGEVTWEGDLSNREISITGSMSRATGSMRARFYDADGNVLTTTGSSTDYTDVLDGITPTTGNVIVPSGAVRMELYSNNRLTTMFVHDIQAPEVFQRPSEPLVSSSVTSRSVTLDWNTSRRVRIFRDNVLLTDDVISSYTDSPLYSDDNHTYKLLFLDEYGNGALDYITHTTKTASDPIGFRGLTPEAFDADTETSHEGDGEVTWEGDLSNREISITGSMSRATGSMRARFYDADGNVLTTTGSSTDYTDVLDGITLTTGNVIVPSGAVRMELYSNNRLTTMFVHDIQAAE